MKDMGKIIFGLIVFLAAVSFPIWRGLTASGAIEKANPVLPEGYGQCVDSREYMIANHMNLLDRWRDEVVRRGDRTPVVVEGVEYEKSLTRTCLKCHADRVQFCDECHKYAGVDPYCWDCHVEEPKGE